MKDKILKQISEELLLEVEFIQVTTLSDNYLDFTINGAYYTAKLTKNGSIKKNSIRRDFS